MFRQIIRNLISKTGYELVNKKKLATTDLLGLKHLNINTIIDVGANQGQFLTNWIKQFPNANFFCFEPLLDEYNSLKDLAQNYSNNVTLINSALGNDEGKVLFHKHNHSPSSSILNTTEKCAEIYPQTKIQANIEINITTLDNYFQSILSENNKEILLKMDVQGFELEVLKGGEKTLKMIIACLLEINFEPLYKDQPSFNEIYTLLNNAGFEYAGAMDQNFNKEGKLVFSDILFIRKSN